MAGEPLIPTQRSEPGENARSATRRGTDPAIISVVITTVCSLFLPIWGIVGTIGGLLMGYKARGEASAGSGGSGALARIAIVFGWLGVTYHLFAVCTVLDESLAQGVHSACEAGCRVLQTLVR